MVRVLVALTCGVLLQGCLAVTSMTKADTLGKGNFDFGGDVGLWGGAVTSSCSQNCNVYLPSANVGGHYGVSDSFDIGGRIGGTLIEVNSKILLTDKSSNFVLSLGPSLGGIFVGSGDTTVGLASIGIPLFIGYKLGPHELTISPRVQNLIVFANGNGGGVGYALLPGLSIGFTAHISDFFELTPEAGFVFPVVSSATANGTTQSASTLGNGVLFNIGIGLHFGRLGKPKPAVEEAPVTAPPPPPPAGSEVPPPPPPPPPP